MAKVDRVDVSRFLLGIQMVTEDAPHGGEMHPDGDEILSSSRASSASRETLHPKRPSNSDRETPASSAKASGIASASSSRGSS